MSSETARTSSPLFNTDALSGFDPTKIVPRGALVEKLEQGWRSPVTAVLIEAQAGQGKTTLVQQLLSESDALHVWHQVSFADGDPVGFLGVLHELLGQALGVRSLLLETMLAHGEVAADGAAQAVELLLDELAKQLDHDAYLVFDDIHLLEAFPLSLALLGRLVQKSPPRLRPVLLSRSPILTLLPPACHPDTFISVTNADLALNRTEVATLFNDLLRLPIASDAVHALHSATEGWVMGMLLLANRVDDDCRVVTGERLASILHHGREAIPAYFISEVLKNVDAPLRRTLAKLSLLQDIPLELARELAEVEDIETRLHDLQRRNFFVRQLDDGGERFGFHHLFKDCLGQLLASEFSAAEIAQLKCAVARWFHDQRLYEQAFEYYVGGGDYSAAHQMLRRVGMTLQAHNRIISLQHSLGRVPEAELRNYPWLAYFRGVVAANVEPPAARDWFDSAREGFCTGADALGELMSLVQLIHFHMTIDSQYHLGRPYLMRAEELFFAHREQLSKAQEVHAANMLLLGHTLFDNNQEKAELFYGLGLQETLERDMKDLECESRLARIYRNIFLGDHPRCREEVEAALPLLATPRVNAINKAILLLGHLNLVVNEADYKAYAYRKDLCRSILGEEMFEQSVFGPFVRLWDIDMYFAQGALQKAHAEMEIALKGDFAGASAHLKSQYLQYHAYLLASDGQRAQALAVTEESKALRAEVGCPFFEAFNAVLIGSTYALLDLVEKAEDGFARGVSRTEVLGTFYSRPTALALRAYWRLERDRDAFAPQDLHALLSELRAHGFRQLWGVTAEMMLCLLCEAVKRGIESDYARHLAAERYGQALLDDGTSIPLLGFHTLGPLEIVCAERVLVRSSDLTTSQRDLLALLLAAPGQQLRQEEVQAALWPDTAAGKARSSFDTLVKRLRQQLADLLGEIPVKHYLVLQKGMLRLENSHVDLNAFVVVARQGLAHLRAQEFWQAEHTLHKALQLWRGEFLGGDGHADRVVQTREELSLLFLDVVQGWSTLLAAGGRYAEAALACSEALKIDPIHEEISRTLYNLHVSSGNHREARKVFRRYGAALRDNDFSAAEVEEILETFWSPAP